MKHCLKYFVMLLFLLLSSCGTMTYVRPTDNERYYRYYYYYQVPSHSIYYNGMYNPWDYYDQYYYGDIYYRTPTPAVTPTPSRRESTQPSRRETPPPSSGSTDKTTNPPSRR